MKRYISSENSRSREKMSDIETKSESAILNDLRDSYCGILSFATTAQSAGVSFRNGSKKAGDLRLEVVHAIRDLDENKARNFMEHYEIVASEAGAGSGIGGELVRISSQSLDVQRPAVLGVSPSGQRKVAVKTVEKKQVIEIYAKDIKKCCRIETSSIHGAPVGDSWFGGTTTTFCKHNLCFV